MLMSINYVILKVLMIIGIWASNSETLWLVYFMYFTSPEQADTNIRIVTTEMISFIVANVLLRFKLNIAPFISFREIRIVSF